MPNSRQGDKDLSSLTSITRSPATTKPWFQHTARYCMKTYKTLSEPQSTEELLKFVRYAQSHTSVIKAKGTHTKYDFNFVIFLFCFYIYCNLHKVISNMRLHCCWISLIAYEFCPNVNAAESENLFVAPSLEQCSSGYGARQMSTVAVKAAVTDSSLRQAALWFWRNFKTVAGTSGFPASPVQFGCMLVDKFPRGRPVGI